MTLEGQVTEQPTLIKICCGGGWHLGDSLQSLKAEAVEWERLMRLCWLVLDAIFSLWDLLGFLGVEQNGFPLKVEELEGRWNSDDLSG